MAFFSKRPKGPRVSAVIAAAGSSSRMEGIDKQMAGIQQLPVVVRSIEALSHCPFIYQIVLVCPSELIPDYYGLVQEYRLDLVSSVVGGGGNRQESVFAGIAACDPEAEYYAIHDGARPLITPEMVEDCILAAVEFGAAALGVPAKDTIKQVDSEGFIRGTPPREELVAIQTPQVFEGALYRRAMALARQEERCYTDDCQLVERAGKRVRVVPGSYQNIKITTPEDLAVAATILRYREEGLEEWLAFE